MHYNLHIQRGLCNTQISTANKRFYFFILRRERRCTLIRYQLDCYPSSCTGRVCTSMQGNTQTQRKEFKGTVLWELRGVKIGINRSIASKSTKAAENVYFPLVMVSIGARQRTLSGKRVQYIIMDRLIPILTPLICRWTVPLTSSLNIFN